MTTRMYDIRVGFADCAFVVFADCTNHRASCNRCRPHLTKSDATKMTGNMTEEGAT